MVLVIRIEQNNIFNTAEIGAMSRDIPHEAKVLVKRMTADPRVKIKEHWKVSSHRIRVLLCEYYEINFTLC